VHAFGTFEAIIGCVAAGMGVAMMPKAVIQQRKMDDAIRFHALPPAIANIKTLLVWRKNVTHHPARQAFADSFGNLSRSDDADGSVTLPEAA
jgi:DNA-binding transcriptional LysR family regulator